MDECGFDIGSLIKDMGFKKVINQIVNIEVNNRLQNKLVELYRLKKLESDYFKASQEMCSMEINHKKELEAVVKEAKDEVKRSIFGGFKFGDIVYFYKDCGEHITCSTCNGSGKVSADFGGRIIETRCPDCSYGKIHIKNYKPIKASVSDITFKQWAQERCTKISIWIQPIRGDSIERDSKDLFKTEEECQKKCDELNVK